jgi:carboxylesterase type B
VFDVQPPVEPRPWDGVFDAKTLPNLCIQDPLQDIEMTHPGWNKFDEDCLKLNVFAPEVRRHTQNPQIFQLVKVMT